MNVTYVRWPRTTTNGDHFVVGGFPIRGNGHWPGMPGTDNQYTRPPLHEYPVGDPGPNPNDFFTGLDVSVPDDPNSLPIPFVP